MSITIDAFGEPFVAEWHSEDWRRFATRNGCLHLVSFDGALEKNDTLSLNKWRPRKLELCWIKNPQFDGDEEPDPENNDLPKAPGNERRLPVEPDTTLRKSGDSSSGNSTLSIQCLAVVQQYFWNGNLDPHPYALSRFTPGVAVVRAELENGRILLLRSADIEAIPSEADQYFRGEDQQQQLARLLSGQQQLAGTVQQIADFQTPTPENKNEQISDPLPFGYDVWDVVVAVLIAEGCSKRDSVALMMFAYGKSREESAKYVGISVKTLGRKLILARQTVYEKLFSRSRSERAKARSKLTDKILLSLRRRYLEMEG